MARRRSAVLNVGVEDPAHVLRGCEVLEERTEVRQFRVVRVVEPRRDGHRVVRVEDVGRWRVVQDYGVADGAAELG